MKILVIGSGGREHAVVDALAQSPKVRKIYASPGNGGMREQAELVEISPDSPLALVEFARKQRIDLTFIGPEVPLKPMPFWKTPFIPSSSRPTGWLRARVWSLQKTEIGRGSRFTSSWNWELSVEPDRNW